MTAVEMRAFRNFGAQAIDIFVRGRGGFVATDIKVEKAVPGEVVDPLIRISESEAQQLMDDLYAAGFRPTDGRETDATARARAAHVADLQKMLDRVLPAALREPTPAHTQYIVDGSGEIRRCGEVRQRVK